MTCDLVDTPHDLCRLVLEGLADRLDPASKGRPCNRCIKRSIGHLCHDEPREPATGLLGEKNGVSGDSGAAMALDPSSTKAETSIDVSPKNTTSTYRNILKAPSSLIVSSSQGYAPKLRSLTKGNQDENRLKIPVHNSKHAICYHTPLFSYDNSGRL